MSLLPTEHWRDKHQAVLSPLAVPHLGGLGRTKPEAEDPHRLRFTVDDGRIRFSRAFNALNGKTQVFRSGVNEHVRTRLTHSYQVASVSQNIATHLGLNDDLAHTIGLTHDIGHSPFGHAGQDQLNACLQQYNLGFEHNLQSYRVVTTLEPKNLNQEVLEGLLKHSKPNSAAHPSDPVLQRGHSLEAQLVNLVDAITYTSHDCQDGIWTNIITQNEVAETALGAKAAAHKKGLIRGLIQLLLDDLYAQYEINIISNKLEKLEDVYQCSTTIFSLSDALKKEFAELKQFLFERMYMSQNVTKQSKHGQQIIEEIFTSLYKNPTQKIITLEQQFTYTRAEALRDFISGLTDKEATDLYNQVCRT